MRYIVNKEDKEKATRLRNESMNIKRNIRNKKSNIRDLNSLLKRMKKAIKTKKTLRYHLQKDIRVLSSNINFYEGEKEALFNRYVKDKLTIIWEGLETILDTNKYREIDSDLEVKIRSLKISKKQKEERKRKISIRLEELENDRLEVVLLLQAHRHDRKDLNKKLKKNKEEKRKIKGENQNKSVISEKPKSRYDARIDALKMEIAQSTKDFEAQGIAPYTRVKK